MKFIPIDTADARPVALDHASLVALTQERAAATPTALAQALVAGGAGLWAPSVARPAPSVAPGLGKQCGNPDLSVAGQVLGPEEADRSTERPAPIAGQRDRS